MSTIPEYDPVKRRRLRFRAEALSPQTRGASLPSYASVMLVIDLCLCGLRAVAVILLLVAALAVQGVPELRSAVLDTALPFEVAAGIGIVLFGVVGNVAMLQRRQWGLVFGVFAALATLASLGMEISRNLQSKGDTHIYTEARELIAKVRVLITFAIRGGLLAAYVGALIQFALWSFRGVRRASVR
ncbi:MAG: hypothetical protein K6T86_04450 [Pirellulales bacterium]|nr:hypothetical protein [Pirellulales bacterium]